MSFDGWLASMDDDDPVGAARKAGWRHELKLAYDAGFASGHEAGALAGAARVKKLAEAAMESLENKVFRDDRRCVAFDVAAKGAMQAIQELGWDIRSIPVGRRVR